MGNERVEIINVQLGLQQRYHEIFQLGGRFEFHRHQSAFVEWKTMLQQEFARMFRIVHHETENGAVCGVQNSKRQNVNLMGTEELDKVMKPPQPIRGKNRELFDRIRTPARNSFSNHTPQLATSPGPAHQELSGALPM